MHLRETACTAESMNTDCRVCGAEGADLENCKCATVESEQKVAPISTSSFPTEDLVDPVIRINLSSDDGGNYAIENGKNCTWTAADFFQPGKAPKGAKITAVMPPTSPSIPVSVKVDSDGTLVDYTLRAPSVGSDSTGLDDSQRGVPQSNEWDTMLNKDSGYIQNWNEMYSWGQDAYSTLSPCVSRAQFGPRLGRLQCYVAPTGTHVGFRPVLEVLNPDTLGSDGLKVVTLDLGGGKLGNSSDAIQIIVKKCSNLPLPCPAV